jgi:hypothetical protein
MNSKLLFTLVCGWAILASCQKTLNTPKEQLAASVVQSQAATGPLNVYVAGEMTINMDHSRAAYWKNGVPVELSNAVHSEASGMYMYGPDRYVSGTVYGKGGVYWKNGKLISMNDAGSSVSGIYVSGKDVYTCGIGYVGGHSARYWKNSQPVKLSSTVDGVATAITVSGTDVYVAGRLQGTSQKGARYWKNAKEVVLSRSGGAQSILVAGTDVYVAGYILVGYHDKAVYWKNGVLISLTDGKREASALSIFRSGTDVYVAGEEADANGTSRPKYWKNGKPVMLPTNSGADATARCIVVDNDHNVYVTGVIKNGMYTTAPVYWKNGTLIYLPTPGYEGGFANSIFLSRS